MTDNRGSLWLNEEVEQLRTEINAGLTLSEIVENHGRTAYAIIGRLQALGIIVPVGRNYHRVDPDPWTVYTEVLALQKQVAAK